MAKDKTKQQALRKTKPQRHKAEDFLLHKIIPQCCLGAFISTPMEYRSENTHLSNFIQTKPRTSYFAKLSHNAVPVRLYLHQWNICLSKLAQLHPDKSRGLLTPQNYPTPPDLHKSNAMEVWKHSPCLSHVCQSPMVSHLIQTKHKVTISTMWTNSVANISTMTIAMTIAPMTMTKTTMT